MNTTLNPQALSPAEHQSAREFCDRLKTLGTLSTGELVLGGGVHLPLPPRILEVLTSAMQSLAEGHAVAVVSMEEEISPQEAASLLNVSRPFAAQLFDKGAIPSRRVGSHRRARLQDVLSYREREQAVRRKALDELAAEGQRLKLGY
ncbi:MAG: plasmid-related protein [Chthoniobacteraceae bacterium]|nr:plasmid-related protein [Chthoniobacteraceae bacterium]